MELGCRTEHVRVEHEDDDGGGGGGGRDNNNLLQLGCYPVAVVILHVNNHEIGYY